MFDWNRGLFNRIAAGHRVDPPFMAIARWVVEHGAEIGIAALIAIWCVRPKQRGALALVGVGTALATLAAHALANTFEVPRPFVAGHSAPWIAHGGRGSFPSAHASAMFIAALGLLALPGLHWAGAAMGVLGLVTAWARIYGGLHYPLDIVGGFILALLLVSGGRIGLHFARRCAASSPGLRRIVRRWRPRPRPCSTAVDPPVEPYVDVGPVRRRKKGRLRGPGGEKVSAGATEPSS